jgi:predicted  nucleic acid-binding Zn-ribbon protein
MMLPESFTNEEDANKYFHELEVSLANLNERKSLLESTCRWLNRELDALKSKLYKVYLNPSDYQEDMIKKMLIEAEGLQKKAQRERIELQTFREEENRIQSLFVQYAFKVSDLRRRNTIKKS